VGTPGKPGVLERIFYPKGIDLLKGSAQCSPSQNPLDCMRSFMNIKRCKPKWSWSSGSASEQMKNFIAKDLRSTLKDCSESDRNTFELSFMHLESTLSTCFTHKMMQSGWAKAGLIGLEVWDFTHASCSFLIHFAASRDHVSLGRVERSFC
jgi:hypothetical protein